LKLKNAENVNLLDILSENDSIPVENGHAYTSHRQQNVGGY